MVFLPQRRAGLLHHDQPHDRFQPGLGDRGREGGDRRTQRRAVGEREIADGPVVGCQRLRQARGRLRAGEPGRRHFPRDRRALVFPARAARAAGDRRLDPDLAVLRDHHAADARPHAQRHLARRPGLLHRHRHRRRADRAGQHPALRAAGQKRLGRDAGRRRRSAAGAVRLDADQRRHLPAGAVHAGPGRPAVQGSGDHHERVARRLAAGGDDGDSRGEPLGAGDAPAAGPARALVASDDPRGDARNGDARRKAGVDTDPGAGQPAVHLGAGAEVRLPAGGADRQRLGPVPPAAGRQYRDGEAGDGAESDRAPAAASRRHQGTRHQVLQLLRLGRRWRRRDRRLCRRSA